MTKYRVEMAAQVIVDAKDQEEAIMLAEQIVDNDLRGQEYKDVFHYVITEIEI